MIGLLARFGVASLLAITQASAAETVLTGEFVESRFLKAIDEAKADSGVLIIRNSLGGANEETFIGLGRIREYGLEVRIYGYCISACTILLAAPKICVSRDARFAFHASYRLESKEQSSAATNFIRMNAHPPGAREAWDKLGAYSAPWDKNVWIDTKILHEKDGIPWCPPRKFK